MVAFQTLRPFPDPTGAALALVPIAPIIEIPVPLNSSYGSKRLNLHQWIFPNIIAFEICDVLCSITQVKPDYGV